MRKYRNLGKDDMVKMGDEMTAHDNAPGKGFISVGGYNDFYINKKVKEVPVMRFRRLRKVK